MFTTRYMAHARLPWAGATQESLISHGLPRDFFRYLPIVSILPSPVRLMRQVAPALAGLMCVLAASLCRMVHGAMFMAPAGITTALGVAAVPCVMCHVRQVVFTAALRAKFRGKATWLR